ncbi:hypothetical protein MRX96_006544 [Rhipicephalus microplus]
MRPFGNYNQLHTLGPTEFLHVWLKEPTGLQGARRKMHGCSDRVGPPEHRSRPPCHHSRDAERVSGSLGRARRLIRERETLREAAQAAAGYAETLGQVPKKRWARVEWHVRRGRRGKQRVVGGGS